MQPEYFTNHLGFIVDYMAEIFRELRKRNYTDAYEHHFRLGNHVEERDRKAIVKTVSGLLKLLHPDGQCTKAELEQYLSFAIEMRRRVKEQLKRMTATCIVGCLISLCCIPLCHENNWVRHSPGCWRSAGRAQRCR